MNQHSVSEDDLQAFVDGELPRHRMREVLVHLGTHPHEIPRLAWYIVQTEEVRRRLHGVASATSDPETERLQAELAQRLRQPVMRPWLRHGVAVMFLLGIGWGGHTLSDEYFELPPVVVEAVQAHQVFGDDRRRPVELTAAAERVMTAWFSDHLDEPVRIPSLDALGLRLVGGRLLSADDGPVAQLIYEDRAGRRLTLCLSSEPLDVGGEVQIAESEGLTAGYWEVGELSYALVAETSETQLTAIAAELGGREAEPFL